MADNKKYYFLKFKEDFFRGHEIMLLESDKDGILYSNILLKMYLLSLKDEGMLKLANNTPYSPQMIATLIGSKAKLVEKAIEKFKSLGLVEEVFEKNTKILFMTNIQSLIGKSSTEADRKKEQRDKIKENENISTLDTKTQQIEHSGQMTDKNSEMSSKCSREIRDKSIEIRDKSIESESKEDTHTPLLGKYQNISLTKTELEQLKTELPSLYQKYIEKLSEYMASTGKTYNSHIATIRKWAKEDSEKNAKTKKAPRNYDYDGDKSL